MTCAKAQDAAIVPAREGEGIDPCVLAPVDFRPHEGMNRAALLGKSQVGMLMGKDGESAGKQESRKRGTFPAPVFQTSSSIR